jgi:uncharacterized protein (TIRG00374 family)
MLKKILSVVTLVLVIVIVWHAWPELVEAVSQIRNMNIWILLLLVPVQMLMFFSAGEIYFSYLRAKGKLHGEKVLGLMRIGLEINFVNHVIPSGGVSGLGYMAWRLRKYNVSAGQATIMYILRYALVAIVTTVFILISALYLTITGAPLIAILVSVAMGLGMAVVVVVAFLVLSKQKRVKAFCHFISRFVNGFVRFVTFGRVQKALKEDHIDKYFTDLHQDYVELAKDKKILKKPMLWAGVYALMDSSTFWVAFLALGANVSLFPVIIAQGLASFVGTVVVTPGGAGFYEASMIWFFVAVGISPATAIVATLVTRVVVLLVTILTGWGFYQAALSNGEGKGKLRFRLPRIIRRRKNGKSNPKR